MDIEHATPVGMCEELAKLKVVVLFSLLVRRQFNDPMNGLIYGPMAGLEAAVLEEFLFLQHANEAVGTLHPLSIEAVRLFMHTIWGGIGGFAVGMMLTHRPWIYCLAGCMCVAAMLHGAWDFLVGFQRAQSTHHTLIGGTLLLISTTVFANLVIIAHNASRPILRLKATVAYSVGPYCAYLSSDSGTGLPPVKTVDHG